MKETGLFAIVGQCGVQLGQCENFTRCPIYLVGCQMTCLVIMGYTNIAACAGLGIPILDGLRNSDGHKSVLFVSTVFLCGGVIFSRINMLYGQITVANQF